MADISKISPDEGITIYDLKDNDAVHWNQAEGYVGKNLFNEIYEGKVIWGNNQDGFNIAANINGCTVGSIIKKNTSYTITKQGGNRFRLVLWGTKPTIPSGTPTLPSIEVVNDNTLTEYTFNSGNYEYCALTCNNVDAYVLDDIKAMLRLSSIPDSTYEPYAMTNRELTTSFLNGNLKDFYAKRITINSNSSIYINAKVSYQPIFMIGQRDICAIFWNWVTGIHSKTICVDDNSTAPIFEFSANRKTKITNPNSAEVSFLMLSYADFYSSTL